MKVFFFPKKFTGQLNLSCKNKWSLCLLLFICFAGPATTFSQTAPLSFTPIPYSAADIIAPGRGAEQWDNGSEKINNPTVDSNQQSLDVYYRFPWTRLEDSIAGKYNWTYFDNIIKDAIDHGQKLSFGIMPVYDGNGTVLYDNAKSAYPLYLHKLMQAATVNSRDWISNGMWIPNWNSSHYLGRLKALHTALNSHILASTYKGVAFKNVIYCIDIRGYGNYGEWHNTGIVNHINEYPTGRRATAATLKTIINHHTQVFKLWPLTIMMAAFDAEQFVSIMNPAEVGYYALTTNNTWGPLGWRRDQWGATDSYLDFILKNNDKKFGSGPAFKQLIVSRFLTSPVTGEPPSYVNPGGPCEYWDLERQLTDYGATTLSNGNWGVTLNECGKENARAAFKKTGYRIVLEGGSITNAIAGKPFTIMLQWKNIGIAPTYEAWNVVFELKNETNSTIWSGTSRFTPKRFAPPTLPSTAATNIADTFLLPVNIPVGNYKLNLIIKDPTGYRAALPLAINGRNNDGSYTLKNISVSPTSCLSPTATISNLSACKGQAFNLVLGSATGVGPHDLTINGTTYIDVVAGQTITTFTPPLQKIWDNNPSPASYEDSPVELGVKFKSSVAGFIKGIRFFSPNTPSGTYTGHLWSVAGALLNTAVFTNVTAGGWQQVLFSTPVQIMPGVTYIASYHTASGNHAATSGGMINAIINGPLTAFGNTVSGGNGLYMYGKSGSFPSNSHNATNYWVDVVFTPAAYTFNLTNVTDNNGCSNTGALQTLTVTSTATCNLPTATIGNSSSCNGQAFNLVLNAATGPGPHDLVINGATYNNIIAGQTITTFTPPLQKIWNANPSPTSYEDSPVELGIKFKSSKSGFIKGIRFFSSKSPSGIYTGRIWTKAGVLLDSAKFINVTANGWQQVLFTNPLRIMADTTYIASYHTATGHYAATSGGLTNAVTNGRLTALGNTVAGGNGLYKYGGSGSFPSNSHNATNYWVDVVFTPDSAYIFKLTKVTDNAGATKSGALQTLTVTSTECLQSRAPVATPTVEKVALSQKSSLSFNSKIQPEDIKMYSLGQNYPNPFNTVTTIQYSIPGSVKVNLSLFDMNGRLVKILVNESKEPGIHTVQFNSGLFSSGLYFYKLQTRDFTAVRKMIIQ